MSRSCSPLELLPNEILIHAFEYLDARDLFRAFYNLNSRLNELLKSLNELCLMLSVCDRDEVNGSAPFLPYIHTLIVKYKTDVLFNQYSTIRRLILIGLPYPRSYKLDAVVLPNLEYLLVILKGSSSCFLMNRFHEPIFANCFPCLKFCSLPILSSIQKTERWTMMMSLRTLKVGRIGLFTYIGILSICPNLNIFYFLEEIVLQTSTMLRKHVKHENLKRLVIQEKNIRPISNVGILSEYFMCVPSLEYLSIHATTYHSRDLQYLLEFDWFASIVSIYLPILCHFYFHLPILQTQRVSRQFNEDTFHRLQQCFKVKQKERYKSHLIIDRKNLDYLPTYDSTDSSDWSD